MVHGIPRGATSNCLDLATSDGDQIPIEQRSSRELTHLAGKQLTPDGIRIENPAFDVTPHRYIAAIITERGIARAPYRESLKTLAGEAELQTASANP